MQRLNTLWQAVSAVSELSELTRRRQTYHFSTLGPVTFYLRAERAEVRVTRWAQPKIEVAVILQASFGWRVATDQDEAGVYIAARRRAFVGGLSRAVFNILVPHDAFLDLHLEDGRVVLEHMRGSLLIPPGPESTLRHTTDE